MIPILIITCVVMIIVFAILWSIMFSSRTRTSKKTIKLSKDKIQESISISENLRKNIRYKRISDALNIIPFGQLTEEKRKQINASLTAVRTGEGIIKTAEEIHVEQYMFLGFYLLVVAVFVILASPAFSLALIGMPFVFNIPLSRINFGVSDEEWYLVTEFRNFFNIYYVQYVRVGANIRLLDVVKSYSSTAPPEMQLFCNRLITDLSNSESVALRNLDRRYVKNADIHRFCSIAQLVSNGDANSDKVIESFRDSLNRKKLSRERKILEKQKAAVERVTTIILYLVCIAMMAVVFWFFANT